MHPRKHKDVVIDIVPATIHPIIEIPELLRLIGSNLTTIEQKTCMLVCKKWYDLFLAFFWHHLDYSHNGIPNLDRHGHLVRSLKIFDVDKDHMSAIAGACHLVQKAKIIVPRVVIWNYLGILVGNVRFIQDLTLHSLSYLRNDHLVAITQLPRIRRLHLGRAYNDRFARLCMGKLLNALDAMPTLSSLRIDGVMLCHDEAKMPPSRPPQNNDILDIYFYPPRESLWARLKRLGGNRSEMNTNQPTEPWRKFNADPLEPRSAWSNKIDLTRPPDLSATLSKLTNLYLSVHWDSSVHAFSTTATGPGSENSVKDSNIDQYHLGHLFMKACNLTELYLDFGHIWISHRETCLSAVTENCTQLEKLTLAGLAAPSGPTRSSVKHFFSQFRPTLRRLLLIECVEMTEALMAIPAKTTTSLLELSLVSTHVSQWTIHQVLLRCHALQTLTWTTNPPLKNRFMPRELQEPAPPPSNIKLPPEPVLSVLVEPWPCGSTILHIEQYDCIEDQEDCETFFRRVERMDRVISFGTSVNDIRKALFENCEEAPPNIAQISYYSTPTLGVLFIPYAANRGIYEVSKDHGWAGNIKEQIKNGWCFRTIQELTLTTTSIHKVHGHTLLSRALTVRELGELLRVFPRLRKIRYKGPRYPLTDMAHQLLEQQGERRVLVVHETQAPSCP